MSVLNRYQGMEDLLNNPEEGGAAGIIVEGSGDAAVETVKAEVAEAMAELEQVSAEVQELRADLEEHEEVVEELQEEVAGQEAMLSGASTFSAAAFAHSYNKSLRLHAKLGGESLTRMGAESISDAATAKIAAVTGQEGFMESIKNGAKKAIEFIKHIFNTVINFFVGLFSSAEGLNRRRAQLEEKLKKAEKLKDKVKLGQWNIGVDYVKNGADILDKGPFTKVLAEALPAFIESGKNLDGINASGFKSAYGALIAAVKEVIKDVAGTPSEKSDKSDKRQVLAARAGFSIYLAYEDKYETEEEILAAARSVKLSFGKTEGAKEFAKGEEVDVKASKAQLQGLLNTVASSVSVMRDSKITQKFSKAERDRVVATLTVKTKENASTKEENGKAIQLVRALYSTGSSLTVSMNKLFVAQGKQALDLVAAHI